MKNWVTDPDLVSGATSTGFNLLWSRARDEVDSKLLRIRNEMVESCERLVLLLLPLRASDIFQYFLSRWRQESETFIEVLSEQDEDSLDLVGINLSLEITF